MLEYWQQGSFHRHLRSLVFHCVKRCSFQFHSAIIQCILWFSIITHLKLKELHKGTLSFLRLAFNDINKKVYKDIEEMFSIYCFWVYTIKTQRVANHLLCSCFLFYVSLKIHTQPPKPIPLWHDIHITNMMPCFYSSSS